MTASRASAPGENHAVPRLLTTLLAIFGAITPLAIDMYLPGVPAMAGDLGVSANEAGLSVSIFFIGMAIGQLIAGPLSDRVGRKPMVVGGLALFMLGGLAAAMAQSFPLLLAARLIQALGACSVTTCSRAAVRDLLDPREAARLFSLLALIGGLIPLVAPMAGNTLLVTAGWRAMFGAMAAAGLAMLLVSLFAFPESRSAETLAQSRGENVFRAYAGLLAQRRLIWVLVAAACNSGAMFTYLANSPAVLMEGLGLRPIHYTMAITANSFALVLFSHFNRKWLERRTPAELLHKAAGAAAVLGAGFLLWAGVLPGSAPILLMLLFAQLAIAAVVQVDAMACALAVDPRRSGSTAALFGAITFAAGALLSWIGGLLYSPDGSGMALVIGLALLGCALSLTLSRDRRPRAEMAS